MDHLQVISALAGLYPGAEWSYDGDGTTLEPTEDADGEPQSYGLQWHDDRPRPTLEQLAAWAPPAEAAAAATPASPALAAIVAGLPADAFVTVAQLTQVIDALTAGQAPIAPVSSTP